MAAASTPGRLSCLASRSAPCLVRTKTSVRAGRAAIVGEHRDLVRRGDREGAVVHRLDRRRGRGDRVDDRVGEVAGARAGRRRGPAWRRTAAAGRRPGSGRGCWVTDGQEPEVGHVVGLVEHGDLDAVQRAGAPLAGGPSSRPGVATTTSTPRASACDLAAHGRTAVDGEHPQAERSASGASASATCWASSRVGDEHERARVRPARARCRSASRASSGRPKASVLPEPVWARPRTSRPARASGSVRDWISNGLVMPISASRVTTTSGRPRSFEVGDRDLLLGGAIERLLQR